MYDKNTCFAIGSDWSSNERIHLRTCTVAYFETLQEATLTDDKLKYHSNYEKYLLTDLQQSGIQLESSSAN